MKVAARKRPFYPPSKSPAPIKASNPPIKSIKKEDCIPRLNFHDRSLNLICHGPIDIKYNIERYTNMEAKVIETLQDTHILYPCDVYIIPYTSTNTHIRIQSPHLNTGSIIKNASDCAIEEAQKTEFMMKQKEEKIKKFRLKIQKRLAFDRKRKVETIDKPVIECKIISFMIAESRSPTKIPNVFALRNVKETHGRQETNKESTIRGRIKLS